MIPNDTVSQKPVESNRAGPPVSVSTVGNDIDKLSYYYSPIQVAVCSPVKSLE